MKEIVADKNLVAKCGLYCGACGSYLRGKCPGCAENVKATWCGIRSCCLENKYSSCADCKTYQEVRDCNKFHNFISRIIGFFLRSDRRACILRIREKGCEEYAREMAEKKAQTIKK